MECVLNRPICKRTLMESKGPYNREECPLSVQPKCMLRPQICPLLPDNDDKCVITKMMDVAKAGGCFADAPPSVPKDSTCPCCPCCLGGEEKEQENSDFPCRLNKLTELPPCTRCRAGMKTFLAQPEKPKVSKRPKKKSLEKSREKKSKSKESLLELRDLTIPDCTLSSRRPFPCSECLVELLDCPLSEKDYDNSKVYCKARAVKCPFTQVVDICDNDCLCSSVPPVDTGPSCPFLPKPCPCCTAPRCPMTRIPPCPLVERKPPSCIKPKCRCFCPTVPNPCSITYPQCPIHCGTIPIQCPLMSCGGPSVCPATLPQICLCKEASEGNGNVKPKSKGKKSKKNKPVEIDIKQEIKGPLKDNIELKVTVEQEKPKSPPQQQSVQKSSSPKTKQKAMSMSDKSLGLTDMSVNLESKTKTKFQPKSISSLYLNQAFSPQDLQMLQYNFSRNKNQSIPQSSKSLKQKKLIRDQLFAPRFDITSIFTDVSNKYSKFQSDQSLKKQFENKFRDYPSLFTKNLLNFDKEDEITLVNSLLTMGKRQNMKKIERKIQQKSSSIKEMSQRLPPATVSLKQIRIKKLEAPKLCKSPDENERQQKIIAQPCTCGKRFPKATINGNYADKDQDQMLLEKLKQKMQSPEYKFMEEFNINEPRDEPVITEKPTCPCKKTPKPPVCSCGQYCPFIISSDCPCGEDCPSKEIDIKIEQTFHVPTCPNAKILDQPKSPKKNDKVCPFAPNQCPIGPYCPFPVNALYDPRSPEIPPPTIICPCTSEPYCLLGDPCPLKMVSPPCPLDPIKPLNINPPAPCPYAPRLPCPLQTGCLCPNSCPLMKPVPCPLSKNILKCPLALNSTTQPLDANDYPTKNCMCRPWEKETQFSECQCKTKMKTSQVCCPCSEKNDEETICALGIKGCPCEKVIQNSLCPLNATNCPLGPPLYVSDTEVSIPYSKVINATNLKASIPTDKEGSPPKQTSIFHSSKDIKTKGKSYSKNSSQSSTKKILLLPDDGICAAGTRGSSKKRGQQEIPNQTRPKMLLHSKKSKFVETLKQKELGPKQTHKEQQKKPKCVLESPECPLTGIPPAVLASSPGSPKMAPVKNKKTEQDPNIYTSPCLIQNLMKKGQQDLECPIKSPPCDMFPKGRCPMGDLGVCNCNYPVAPCILPAQCGDCVAPPQYCFKEDCCMGLPLPPTYPASHGKYETGIFYQYRDWKPGEITTKHYVEMLPEPPEMDYFHGWDERQFNNWFILRGGKGYEQCKKIKELIEKRGPVGERGTQFDERDNPLDVETKIVIENRLYREKLQSALEQVGKFFPDAHKWVN